MTASLLVDTNQHSGATRPLDLMSGLNETGQAAPLLSDANQRLEKALQYVTIHEDAIERLKRPKPA